VEALPISLSVEAHGSPPALALWLDGARRSDAALVTVLYRPAARGSCPTAAPPPTTDVERACGLLCALAPHACAAPLLPPPAAPPPPGALLRLAERAGRGSAIARELAARLRLCGSPAGGLLLAALLDVALGCLCGELLGRHAEAAGAAARSSSAALLQRLPARSAAWLASAKPMGVKLHLPLCESLSDGLRRFAVANAAAGDAVAPHTLPMLRVLARAGALGASAQAALLADAVGAVAAPLALLRRLAAAWLTLHAAGIRNLYRKLYRPCGAAEAYRLERLTVGALLLTPLLLLAPTLGAYCAVVTSLAAVPAAARWVLMRAPGVLRSAARLPCRRTARRLRPTFTPLRNGCYRMALS
jgi:hypothetical protein